MKLCLLCQIRVQKGVDFNSSSERDCLLYACPRSLNRQPLPVSESTFQETTASDAVALWFLYHFSISLLWARPFPPHPPYFPHISSQGRDFLSSLFSVFAPELLSPSGVCAKSQGLAGVHTSVTCLFSHQAGAARERGAPTANQQARRRNIRRVLFDISDGVVWKKWAIGSTSQMH